MGKAIFGKNSITCIRGPLASMNSVLKDRQGNEWFCKFAKEDFEKLGDDYHVEVKDSNKISKKFFKSYLTFVKSFEDHINETTNSDNKQQDSL